MKRCLKALLFALLTAALVLCARSSAELVMRGYSAYDEWTVLHERGTYVLWLAWCAAAFAFVHRRLRCRRAATAWALGSAALFTGAVCLFNNLLHWLEWLAMVSEPDPAPFLWFLKEDLRYSIGFGALRYPCAFVLMLLVCGLIALVRARLAAAPPAACRKAKL